ncbi:multidrug transporter [Streptomyces spiralis]|uniref:Multidrug transporter n=1 Tax=Streptomyces spiralis TaxID=66376 RepID=A0A919AAE8_9ACTN|nr:multidrug transporter [Streptomyces spiralis]
MIAVGALLALLASLAYGSADFAAGVGSRRLAAGPVTMFVQAFGLLAAGAGVLLIPGAGPTTHALTWGALSGLGSAMGTLALYRGFSVGAMSVTATCSAVLTAVIPAIVGLLLGDHLSLLAMVGIVLAVPAVSLVSWQPQSGQRGRAGLTHGIVAGAGFALLFVALDRAGTASGAWPLVPGQAAALLLVLPFACRAHLWKAGWRPAALPTVVAGILTGTANLLFLAATGHGQLAVVAVITALYPAVTVLLARVLLAERSTRLQTTGLFVSAAAVALTSLG